MSANTLNALVCVEDFEEHAKRKLPKQVYDYYRSGADDEITLKRNVDGFKRLIIRPRFMRDVSSVNTSVTLLNDTIKLDSPICLAPTASQKMAHPEGELATARAASELGAIMVVSTIATTRLEDVSKAAPRGRRWFQLYIYKDRAATETVVKRAERSGYEALVVTVDTPVAGKRRNDVRNSFALPSHLRMENFTEQLAGDMTEQSISHTGLSGFQSYVNAYFDSSISWSTIDWLKSITKLPIMVKGILTAEDAIDACDHGIHGIFVSNHGARQLDSTPATIEALPEIVKAVNKRCDVYLDGGVRSGVDVFKALALGAKAVFIGRPYLWGLTYDGKNGVKAVVDILKTELETTMKLSGCRTVNDIQTMKNLVVHERYYSKI